MKTLICWPLKIKPSVCRPPECTTTAGLHLVRRPSWVQAEEHDPAGDQDGGDVRDDRAQDGGDVHVDRDNVQGIEVCRIGLMFPIYSISYILCPWISFSQVSSHFFFHSYPRISFSQTFSNSYLTSILVIPSSTTWSSWSTSWSSSLSFWFSPIHSSQWWSYALLKFICNSIILIKTLLIGNVHLIK